MNKRPAACPPVLRAFRIAALLGFSTGLLPAARAYTYTWTGNGNQGSQPGWSYFGNWVNGQIAYPTTSTDIIFGSISQANGTASFNDVADPFTLRSLTFTSTAPAYTLTGGRLTLDSGGGGAGAGASLTTNTPSAITINNVVTVNDFLTINLGAGAGPLNFAGGLNIPNEAVFINAGTVGGMGNILSGNITGSAAISVVGAGTLTLTGNNTYSQDTVLDSGTLSLGSAGAVRNSVGILFAGGTLQFTAANTTDYSARFVSEDMGAYRIDTNGQNVTFASALTNSLTTGVALVKLGSGALTLTAANSYTGGTFVNAGTLVALNNGSAISGGTATIAAGAILALNNTSTSTAVLQTQTTFTGTGVLQKLGAGNVQFGGNGGNVNVSLGAGGFIDVEAGTLSGSNSNQGIWTNNQGGLNIASGATFDGVEGTIRVDALTGAGTLKGGYGGAGSTTIGVANGAGTFAGVIADSGDNGGTLSLIKAGTGLQILQGNNTYTGTTTISAGTLQIGNNTPVGSLGTGAVIDNSTLGFDRSDSVTVANAISGTGSVAHIGGSTLTLTGANTYAGLTIIGGGNGTSTLQVGNGGTTGSVGSGGIIDNDVLAINRSNNLTLANAISGVGALTKLGAGTLTLTGANTYSGTTAINAGTVSIGSASALGNGGQINVAGGTLLGTATLTLNHSISFTAGGTGVIAAAPGTTLTLSTSGLGQTLDGSGNLVFGAPGQTGTVVLGADNLSAASSFTLTVNAGTLRTGTEFASFPNHDLAFFTSVATTTTVAAGAVLDYADNTSGFAPSFPTIGNLQGAGLVTGGTSPDTVLSVGGGNFSGAIFGAAGLRKATGATLVLSGANTFTGGTALNAGTLQLANTYALEASTLTTSSSGGTLAFSSGLGSVTLGGLAGTGNVALTDLGGSAIALTAGSDNDSTTYSGVLGGPGSLTKAGSGTLTLAGTNTFAGGTTVSAGTLSVASDANLGAAGGAVTLTGNGQLTITGAAFTTGRTFNLNNGSLTPAAGGTITYAGATINDGSLGAGGTHVFTDGTSLNGTTALAGSALSQTGGTVVFNAAEVRGSFTQTGGTLNATGTLFTASSSLAVGGTINTNDVDIEGPTTINSGGTVSNTANNLTLGARTTVNAGGVLATAGNVSIQVNNAALVNNGSLSGLVNVNSGAVVYGTGNDSAATIVVNRGGQYGNNTSAGGGTGQAVAPAASSTSPFWAALDRAEHANPLPFIGPQAATTPQATTVGSLALGQGSTFNFNLQNTQLPAGQGSDLTSTGVGGLLLAGTATAGNQITIRLISLDANGNNGTAANFDPSQNYAFTLVSAGGRLLGYTPGEFTVNTTSFANNTQGGVFSVVQQGSNLVLVFTAVPEPSTWVAFLGGVGLLGLMLRRRLRMA